MTTQHLTWRNAVSTFRRSIAPCRLLAVLLLTGACLSHPPALAAQDAAVPKDNPAASGDKPVAMVAGQPIYESELLQQASGQLQQLRNQEFEVKRSALDNMVIQRLVEVEAESQKLSIPELLNREVDSKVRETTDEEIKAFYEGQKDRINRPLEEVKDQVAALLKQQRGQQARQDYFASLRRKLPVDILLEPVRLNVQPDPQRVRGPASAPITIVEFSDFQCPFCRKAYPVVRQVLAKYGDKVRFSYRDFPLRNIHGQAQEAAEAARCAEDQNKFWQFHDYLFENPNDLTREKLMESAGKLSMDTAALELCIESGKYRNEIERDYQEGIQAGINGTPAFYINGIFLNGSQPATAFEQIIDSELARLGVRDTGSRTQGN